MFDETRNQRHTCASLRPRLSGLSALSFKVDARCKILVRLYKGTMDKSFRSFSCVLCVTHFVLVKMAAFPAEPDESEFVVFSKSAFFVIKMAKQTQSPQHCMWSIALWAIKEGALSPLSRGRRLVQVCLWWFISLNILMVEDKKPCRTLCWRSWLSEAI